jgi:hypothetical protein
MARFTGNGAVLEDLVERPLAGSLAWQGYLISHRLSKNA